MKGTLYGHPGKDTDEIAQLFRDVGMDVEVKDIGEHQRRPGREGISDEPDAR